MNATEAKFLIDAMDAAFDIVRDENSTAKEAQEAINRIHKYRGMYDGPEEKKVTR